MAEKKQIVRKLKQIKKWALAHKIATGLILAGSFVLCATAVFINNNISLTSDSAFEKQLDNAIKKAIVWTETHKNEILTQNNIGLIKMLSECDKFKQTPIFTDIVTTFMSTPAQPSCWKRYSSGTMGSFR